MKKALTRFRRIKKWGSSLVIVLSPTDIKDLGIKEHDEIDISDCYILSKDLKKLKEDNNEK